MSWKSDGPASGLSVGVLVWADESTTKIGYAARRALTDRCRLSDDLAARLAGIDVLRDAVIRG